MLRLCNVVVALLLLLWAPCAEAVSPAAKVILFGCTAVQPLSGGLYDATSIGAWAGSAASISSGSILSPSCQVDARSQIENTANSNHAVFVTVTATIAATAKVFTIYAKRNVGVRNISINIFSSSFASAVNAGFDLGTCVVSIAAFPSGSFTLPTASAEKAANGWCKVTVGATVVADTSLNLQIDTLSGTAEPYTGDGVSSVAYWGLDLR